MNTFFAVAFGGVLLFVIGRTLFTVYKIGQTKMGVNDRRVASVIVVAIVVASVALVIVLHSAG